MDKIIDSTDGLPIGNYVSQYLGNLYLSYFDHYCKEKLKIRYYYRYCDDIVVFGDNKIELRNHLDLMRLYLKDKLLIEINNNYQIFPINKRGVDFIGYIFFHNKILLRKQIKSNIRKNLRINNKSSYLGWLKFCNCYNLKKKFFH